MSSDHFNALFEFISAMLLMINVVRLYKDKKLQGVSIVPTMFFTLWGFWNLYYYPSLNQFWSFVGGIFVVVVNLIWVIMALYYRSRNAEKSSRLCKEVSCWPEA